MFARTLKQLAVSLVAAGGLLLPFAAEAGDCGCEEAPPAVCHHPFHHRHRCHRCATYAPSAMVVPSMAMPMMAAPVMAAPVNYTLAAAPTYTLAPQAAPQYQLQAATCAGTSALTQDQLVRALAMLSGGGGSAAPAAAPNQSLESRVADLERRVQTLEAVTKELETLSKDTVDVLKRHAAELKTLSGK